LKGGATVDATKFLCPVCDELIPTTQSEFPVLRNDRPVYQRIFVSHNFRNYHGGDGPAGDSGVPCRMSGGVAFPAPIAIEAGGAVTIEGSPGFDDIRLPY
jgi:hypothetical protein